mgnify:CR=1 FL=1
MKNREKFIKSWGKTRQKGKCRYIAGTVLLYTAIYWGLTIMIRIARGNGLTRLHESLPAFIAGIIGVSFGISANWNRNEDKYYFATRE